MKSLSISSTEMAVKVSNDCTAHGLMVGGGISVLVAWMDSILASKKVAHCSAVCKSPKLAGGCSNPFKIQISAQHLRVNTLIHSSLLVGGERHLDGASLICEQS
jgi:hypothetical protein